MGGIGKKKSGELLGYVGRFLFGSLSSRLMVFGVGFICFSWMDVALYVIQTVCLKKTDVDVPGTDFGWSQGLGLALFGLGLLLHFLHWKSANKQQALSAKTAFLQRWRQYGPPKLQAEMERLYGIKSVDVPTARAVLGHMGNVSKFLGLFQHCHNNVVYESSVFRLKDKWLRTRYNIGFVLWLVIPIHIVLCLFLLVSQFIHPALVFLSPLDWKLLLLLVVLEVVAACVVFQDLKGMGSAVTFVNGINP